MKACKHLDYEEGKYTGCTIQTLAPHFPEVRYWLRDERWTDEGNPAKVQFCGKGRGRINGIFQCYNEGEMSCYAGVEQDASFGKSTDPQLFEQIDQPVELARSG